MLFHKGLLSPSFHWLYHHSCKTEEWPFIFYLFIFNSERVVDCCLWSKPAMIWQIRELIFLSNMAMTVTSQECVEAKLVTSTLTVTKGTATLMSACNNQRGLHLVVQKLFISVSVRKFIKTSFISPILEKYWKKKEKKKIFKWN